VYLFWPPFTVNSGHDYRRAAELSEREHRQQLLHILDQPSPKIFNSRLPTSFLLGCASSSLTLLIPLMEMPSSTAHC
jgi:hypothetical protein